MLEKFSLAKATIPDAAPFSFLAALAMYEKSFSPKIPRFGRSPFFLVTLSGFRKGGGGAQSLLGRWLDSLTSYEIEKHVHKFTDRAFPWLIRNSVL